MNTFDRRIGIYIHIPFCKRKCRYCDFLSGPASEEEQTLYTKALLEEIRSAASAAKGYTAGTIFIGGGTPSLLDPGLIGCILEEIHCRFRLGEEAECTIEANPGTLDNERLHVYGKCGINRLSIGLQSAVNDELSLLGRIHTWEDFIGQYHEAREEGFKNINIDLMSGIPGQTPDSWLKTLEAVSSLEPEHISAYSLILEPGTELARYYVKRDDDKIEHDPGWPPLPDEETERYIYHLTRDVLASHGYTRYEISNYCREGFACRHNIGYWTGGEYLGLGLGASSYMNHIRFCNTDDMQVYIKNAKTHMPPVESEEFPGYGRLITERTSRKEEMEEFMFLGLRMTAGISEEDFRKSFGKEVMEIYGKVISRYDTSGFMEHTNGRIWLTDRGTDVSNRILADFLL